MCHSMGFARELRTCGERQLDKSFIYKTPVPGVGLLTLPSGDYRCHLLTDAPSLGTNDVF